MSAVVHGTMSTTVAVRKQSVLFLLGIPVNTGICFNTVPAYVEILRMDQSPDVLLVTSHTKIGVGLHDSPCSIASSETRIELLVRLRQMLPLRMIKHHSIWVFTLAWLRRFRIDRVIDLRLFGLQRVHPLGSGTYHCIEHCRPSHGRRLEQCLSQRG